MSDYKDRYPVMSHLLKTGHSRPTVPSCCSSGRAPRESRAVAQGALSAWCQDRLSALVHG